MKKTTVIALALLGWYPGIVISINSVYDMRYPQHVEVPCLYCSSITPVSKMGDKCKAYGSGSDEINFTGRNLIS